uniref:Xylulose kinase-1 n=1 Tax=Tanacetum cinerariifolium TaxID=118510 RepID=A0A6L2MW82_TANCI|nr:hypothetical protein [Tanacetum cinerariifolium]
MSTLKFAETHNMIVFLSKPSESEGFEQIIDFLNANPIKYALTMNLTVYTSCIEQFWTTEKAKNINGEAQIHAKVDAKKVIISEASIRIDLRFGDEGGINCFSNEVILEQLTLIGFVQVFLNNQLEGIDNHTRTYVIPSDTENVFGNMRRVGKDFSGKITPLFLTMMVQAQEEIGKGYADPTDPHHTPTITQPSTSKPQKKQKPRKPRRRDTKETQPSSPTTNVEDEAFNEENVSKHSNDPLHSGKDRIQLKELMEICTNLQQRFFDLETTKTSQAQEITSLKKRVKRLEKKRRLRTHGLKRLYKVGLSASVDSSTDKESLGKEDASKQGRISDIDVNQDIYLVNVHRDENIFGVNDQNDTLMFDYNKDLQGRYSSKVDADYQLAARKEEQTTYQSLTKEYYEYLSEEYGWITELVEESTKKDNVETVQESSSKRARDDLDQERSKKQKVEDDKESTKLKQCLKIILYDGDENFDREDLEVLWRLVKDRFIKTKPVDDMDSFLLHTLKTMFEHHVEDNVWKNQQGLNKVKNWKLFDSYGVHYVTMQNILYYLLVEKMYPLTNQTLHQMFNNVKLQVDDECEMAYKLLRLVKKQLKEGYRTN